MHVLFVLIFLQGSLNFVTCYASFNVFSTIPKRVPEISKMFTTNKKYQRVPIIYQQNQKSSFLHICDMFVFNYVKMSAFILIAFLYHNSFVLPELCQLFLMFSMIFQKLINLSRILPKNVTKEDKTS